MFLLMIHKFLQFLYIFIFSNLKNYEKYIEIYKLKLKNNYICNKLSIYGEYILRRYIVFIDKIINLKSINKSILRKKTKKSLTTFVMKYVYIWVLFKRMRQTFCKNHLLIKLRDEKIKMHSFNMLNKIYPYAISYLIVYKVIDTIICRQRQIYNDISNKIYNINLKLSKLDLVFVYYKKLIYLIVNFLNFFNCIQFINSFYLKSKNRKKSLFKHKKMLNLNF